MSCANKFCVNFLTHRQQTRAPVDARAKMAGFSCSAILALYLTAITFSEGASMSMDRTSVPAATVPGSNVSLEQAKTPTLISTENRDSKEVKHVDNGQNCPNCDKNKDDYPEDSEMYELRIAMIKAKILQKLHMDKEPVLKEKAKDKKIAALLLNLNLIGGNEEESEPQESDDESYGQTTKIIVFSEKAKVPPSRSKRNSSRKLIFQFTIEQKSLSSSVSSAFLWVHKRKSKHYKQNEKTLHLEAHDVKSHRGAAEIPISRVMKTKLKAKKSGSEWVMVDVKEIVQHWFNKKTQQHESSNATDSAARAIVISCLDCDSNTSQLISSRGRLRPFLVIEFEKSRKLNRKKRNVPIDCEGPLPTACCRRSFYVNFSKIGWDWILVPNGFHANFCEGSCESRISLLYGYSLILQEMNRKNLTPIPMCCTPSKMSALSIIYYDYHEQIIKTDVSDMRVDECGCS